MRHCHIAIRVTMLCTALSPCYAEVIDLEGTVKAVDAAARTLTIERKTLKGTKTLELEVTKKAGDLAGVRVGDRIAFSYDPDLELVTRINSGNRKLAHPQDAVSKAGPAKKGPGEREKQICKEVCRKLEQEHFLKPRIDRELTGKMLDSFLRSLDPMKMYFLQSDIDFFKKEAAALPMALKEGDVTLAYKIYHRFIERVSAQLPATESLINAPHDFTKDESMEIDQASTLWASSDSEAKDKWRKRIKYDLLIGKMQDESETAVKERLLRRYRSFKARMETISSDELLEGFLSALYASVDGISRYMSPESLANFEIGMRKQLDGIGAQLKSEDGQVTIVALTPGGPAAKDGRLKPGDRIVGIAQGSSSDFVDIQDVRLNDVVDLVRGKRGTVVRLKVMPPGKSSPAVYDITRSKIELKDADVSGAVFDAGRKTDGDSLKVGLIRVPSFYSDTEAMRRGENDFKSAARDCAALLEGFKRQSVDCVVIDVRDSSQGFTGEMTNMIGLFIDRGRVQMWKTKDGSVQKLEIAKPGRVWAGPLVVLVNEQTGSVSEGFAGAIQDHNRGVVVGGESTAGNAVHLDQMPVDPNKPLGAVVVATAVGYRSTDEGIQNKGICSDVTLPSVLSYSVQQSRKASGVMAFDRIPSDGFTPAEGDLSDITRTLVRNSESRIGKDPIFQKVTKIIERMRDGAGKASLKDSEFQERWNAFQMIPSHETVGSSQSSIRKDYYLDEVLNIAADLTKELAKR